MLSWCVRPPRYGFNLGCGERFPIPVCVLGGPLLLHKPRTMPVLRLWIMTASEGAKHREVRPNRRSDKTQGDGAIVPVHHMRGRVRSFRQ